MNSYRVIMKSFGYGIMSIQFFHEETDTSMVSYIKELNLPSVQTIRDVNNKHLYYLLLNEGHKLSIYEKNQFDEGEFKSLKESVEESKDLIFLHRLEMLHEDIKKI